MKIDNGNNRQERRKKRVVIPIVYFLAEITLGWLILSIVNLSFYIKQWTVWSYSVMIIIFLYSLSKTFMVYKRQKKLKAV